MRARFHSSGETYGDLIDDVNLAYRAALTEERVNLLHLVRLQAVSQIINEAVSIYTDTDLQTLVWLDR
jgi:hypothetical protein